ncbi:deoxyhypusine synthase family protein [Crocosphaera sp. UHCC 0190]|uniref:deoxyhypusine synthase family protein n=1 Tax=Crocosphaera sp. UHCC 0190 TaxID=3110246 RepID=UPI002B2207F5|nr:deoxyhypusine synthase family protein [Crocosphaera sp. UHCC 0190]MEA5508393.1 deoxyhypusine synthase family protein [Crocosphaera sp. UHCC 0190]
MNTRHFMQRNFRHFNAAACRDAAEGWVRHLQTGNKMLVTLAGAMSTAELGISLAEMIRADKVHGICCTGANLEEDIFNLVAHNHYKRIPHYRYLTTEDETILLDNGLNRVTDTCIPEEEAMRKIESHLLTLWQKADRSNQRFFPYEYTYQLLESGLLKDEYQIDPKDSWVIAAWQKGLKIFTPGWEDSTLGNMFVSQVIKGNLSDTNIMKSGLEQMQMLVKWYQENTQTASLGFFQIGGGIAGDFPICVVPLIQQDLKLPCKLWGYFAQISDSTTSYGSYSGAVPNEKITWGKLDVDTPSYVIESDATIVAPLIFNYVLES